MAMNFVTFNQDYSYLAVGELFPPRSAYQAACKGSRQLTPASDREGIPYLYHRTICQELRDKGREYCGD